MLKREWRTASYSPDGDRAHSYGSESALGVIADPNATSRWRGGSLGGGHLALKGTAGPRAASPGGGTADPRVGCPRDQWP